MRIKQNLLVCLLLVMSFICIEVQAKSGGIETASQFGHVTINQKAPDFSLSDTHNKTVKLSDFQGKYVVLEWFNQDCPFVKKHYDSGNMQKLQKQYTDKGIIWLSICSSAPGKHGYASAAEYNKIFSDKKSAPTAILMDPTGKVGHMYDVRTTPDMFVINPEGVLIYEGAIDNTPGTDTAEIAGAKNYVSAALDESLADKPVSIPETKSYGCSVKY